LCQSKNVEQQTVLSLHRVRQGFIRASTAQANQIRGLLGEYGVVVPQGISNISLLVPDLIEDATNDMPGAFRQLIERLLEHLKLLDQQVGEIVALSRGGLKSEVQHLSRIRCRNARKNFVPATPTWRAPSDRKPAAAGREYPRHGPDTRALASHR
jgi:transposase